MLQWGISQRLSCARYGRYLMDGSPEWINSIISVNTMAPIIEVWNVDSV